MSENTNKLNSAFDSFKNNALQSEAPYQRVNKNIEQVNVTMKRPVKKEKTNASSQAVGNNIDQVNVMGKRPVKKETIKADTPQVDPVIKLKQDKVADKSSLLLDIRNGGVNKDSSTIELRRQLEADNWKPEEINNAIKHSDRLYDFTQNKKYHIDLFGLENKLQGLNPADKTNK